MRGHSERFERLVFFIFIALLVFLYIYGHNRYMVEHVDDAWTLSWAKTWWDTGNVYDTTFGYIDGDGGTSLFSRSYVFLYGAILQIVGWSRGGAFVISTTLIVASSLLWGRIVKKIGYCAATARWFPLVILALETYFAAAHKTRVDAMAFFLATSAFALFVHKRYFFSGILALIGAETHPYGLTVFMYIFSYLMFLWPDMRERPRFYLRKALVFIAGALIGLGYYLLLHFRWLDQTGDLGGRMHGNSFYSYFFVHRYSWRHLPELLIWLAALGLFIRARRWKKDKFLLPFLVLTSITSLLLPHGNFHYLIYLYPPFILLILEESRRLNLRVWTMAALMVLMIPQYGWLFRTQREYKHSEYIAELKERVPDSPEFIYGHGNAWFAFNDRDFHGPGYFGRAGLAPDGWPLEFLVIENREFKRNGGWNDLDRGEELYEKRVFDEWEFYDGSPVRVWMMSRKEL